MTSAHDIAAYVLERRGAMSAMKLQKLVYYVQAWSLVVLDRPAFREPLQAWERGPVVYELFKQHRGQFVVATWPHGDGRRLDRDVRRLADAVLLDYGDLTADQLSERTHSETPWLVAREGIPDSVRASPEITQASMAAFYRRQPRPPALANAFGR